MFGVLLEALPDAPSCQDNCEDYCAQKDFLELLSKKGKEIWGPTEAFTTNCDLGAVGLVDTSVNLLEVVDVRDDLVTGDKVLFARFSSAIVNKDWSWMIVSLACCRESEGEGTRLH